MADDFGESILHVCSTLNECFVEYLVVGGAAVGLHGYFRDSTGADSKPLPKPDLDIWYNPTYDNL